MGDISTFDQTEKHGGGQHSDAAQEAAAVAEKEAAAAAEKEAAEKAAAEKEAADKAAAEAAAPPPVMHTADHLSPLHPVAPAPHTVSEHQRGFILNTGAAPAQKA